MPPCQILLPTQTVQNKLPRAAPSSYASYKLLTAVERDIRKSRKGRPRPLGPLSNSNCLFRTRTVSFEFELSLLNSNCLFRIRTVSFELELSLSNSAHSADRQLCCRLELSKTSFQWPFRRKAPIGNEVAKPRCTLSINSLRPSSGIIGHLERADPWVLFRIQTVSFEFGLSLLNSNSKSDACLATLGSLFIRFERGPKGRPVANRRFGSLFWTVRVRKRQFEFERDSSNSKEDPRVGPF